MTSRLQARLLAQRALFQRIQGPKKRSKLQAGFTLIELLIVVVIIGILSAIAIPNFVNQRNKAYQASGDSWASGQARACAASLASGDAASFTSSAAPDMGDSGITVSGGPTCAAAGVWRSGAKSWTVGAGGTVTYSGGS